LRVDLHACLVGNEACGSAQQFRIGAEALSLPAVDPSAGESSKNRARLCSFVMPTQVGIHVFHEPKARMASLRPP